MLKPQTLGFEISILPRSLWLARRSSTMCSKLLAVVTSLLLFVGNSRNSACQHASHTYFESGTEADHALSMLQKSSAVPRRSSSIRERSHGRDMLNRATAPQQDKDVVKMLKHTLHESDELRVPPSADSQEGSSFGNSEIRIIENEAVQDVEDGHKATFRKTHSEFTVGAQRSRAWLDGQAAVASINARFGNGRPSNKFNEAGVVVHAFDGKFLSGADDGSGWSATYKHWSASIINSRVPYMFLGDVIQSLHAGFIISPEAAAASLLCSYDGDGSTMNLYPCYDGMNPAADCIEGCIGLRDATPTAPQAVRQWCRTNTTMQPSVDRKAVPSPADDRCAWPPNALDAMMRLQEVQANGTDWVRSCRSGACLFDNPYNEIVLDPNKIQNKMPQAIEAIYFVTGLAASSLSHEHATTGESEARRAQRFLLKMHGMRVPLVRFEVFRTHMPFQLVSEVASH